MDILHWPGVLRQAETDIKKIQLHALQTFEQALGQIREICAREGAELRQFILQRINNMEEEIGQIRQQLPALLQAQRDKIVQRLEQAEVKIGPNRLEQELVFLALKADVNEELDRLTTHVTEVRRILNSDSGAVGRRLDFLMQELNREANTLSSKAIDAGTTSAVNLKVFHRANTRTGAEVKTQRRQGRQGRQCEDKTIHRLVNSLSTMSQSC